MRRKLAPHHACLAAALVGAVASPAGGFGAVLAAVAVMAILTPFTYWDAPAKAGR